jgi:hypothetical protein
MNLKLGARKIYLIFLWCVFSTPVLLAQSKFSIGCDAAIGHHSNLKQNKNFGHTFTAKTPYGLHLNARYNFSERLGVEMGLGYIGIGYNTQFNWITPDGNIHDPLIFNTNNVRLSYIDIPISIIFNLKSEEKWGLFLTGGLSSSFLVGTNGYQYYENGLTGKLNDKYTSYLPMCMGGIGFQFNITSQATFIVHPQVRIVTRAYDSFVESPQKIALLNIGFMYAIQAKQ